MTTLNHQLHGQLDNDPRVQAFALVGAEAPSVEGERVQLLRGPGFALELRRSGTSATVLASGELDLRAHDELVYVLDELSALEGPVHLELSLVTFCDLTGIAPLIACALQRQARYLSPLEISGVSPAVRRLLELRAGLRPPVNASPAAGGFAMAQLGSWSD